MNPRYLISTFGLCLLIISAGESQIPATTPGAERPNGAVTSTRVVTREDREAAFASIFEGQRYLDTAENLRSAAAIAENTRRAKLAFQRAVDLDPSLAEGYTALASIAVSSPPNDVNEGIRLATLAVKINPDNFGARRLLARLSTFRSHLNSGTLDLLYAKAAIDEWKEITRLDPRNAEAWAFLAEFYERTGKPVDRIVALQKWLASAPPLETQFFMQIMGPSADLNPESASLKLGSALLTAGRRDEAVRLLATVIEDNPENSEAVELLRDALEKASPDESAVVIGSLRQAIYNNPKNLTLISFLAEVYQRSGKLADAEQLLRDSVTAISRTDKAGGGVLLVALGDIYAKSNHRLDAIAAFEEALAARGIVGAASVTSDEREFAMLVIDKLIQVYREWNKPNEVVSLIERSRKLFGADDLFADRQLISYYRATGKRQQALEVIQSVRKRNPLDQGFLRLEATVMTELGKVDQAVDLVREFAANRKIKPTPKSAAEGDDQGHEIPTPFDEFSNLLFISGLYSDAGRGTEAAAAAKEAYSVAGSDDRRQIAELTLASALQTSGDFVGAERTLRDLLKRLPGNPIALNNLGYFLVERNERLEEAVAFIQEALKIEPDNPSYLDSLGLAYFKLGKLSEAEKSLRTAFRFDSGSAAINEHLGDVLNGLGREKEARIAWQRALDLASGTADVDRIREKLR